MKLNLGCGRSILPGWVNVDRSPLPGVDYATELDSDRVHLDYPPSSVDEFLLSHVLEHIHKPLPLMQELWRLAKPGAIATIRTPYGSSDDAWEDPTHVRPMFPHSFGYYSQPFYWRADYQYRGDWRVKHIKLLVDRWCDMATIRTARNVVKEMIAVLEAVKPIREPKRELQESMNIQMVVG